MLVHSLDGGHDAVDGGDVVNAPGDQSRLVKVCSGLPHCDANLDAPEKEDQLPCISAHFVNIHAFLKN